MPTRVHERFLRRIDNDIHNQLAAIRYGSGKRADFAQSVDAWGSADIKLDGSEVERKPDISFGHDNAKFPGVIVEIGYSQNTRSLNQKAEDYLIDSKASIRVVICVELPYQDEKSRDAMFTAWQPQKFQTPDGPRVRAVAMIKDEAFRDEEWNTIDTASTQLRLSDFTYEELAS